MPANADTSTIIENTICEHCSRERGWACLTADNVAMYQSVHSIRALAYAEQVRVDVEKIWTTPPHTEQDVTEESLRTHARFAMEHDQPGADAWFIRLSRALRMDQEEARRKAEQAADAAALDAEAEALWREFNDVRGCPVDQGKWSLLSEKNRNAWRVIARRVRKAGAR